MALRVRALGLFAGSRFCLSVCLTDPLGKVDRIHRRLWIAIALHSLATGLCSRIEDCYTSARGSTGTLGNFAKATYAAVAATYAYLTPDLWKETIFQKSPYQEFSDHLAKSHKPVSAQKQEVKQY